MAFFIEIPRASTTTGSLVSTPTPVTLPSAGTEYSLVIPTGTKSFSIKSRFDGKLYIAYQSGAIGAGTYWSVIPGNYYLKENLNLDDPLIVYVVSSRNGDILEIETVS